MGSSGRLGYGENGNGHAIYKAYSFTFNDVGLFRKEGPFIRKAPSGRKYLLDSFASHTT